MPGLILLHGFGGAPQSWDAFCRQLPADQVVWAPELVGHGAPCRADTGFEDEVNRLLGELPVVAERTGTNQWWLVGYSMGGRLALGMLVGVRPSESDGVSLLGASLIGANPGLEGDAPRRERRQADARWARLLEEQGIEAFLDAWRAQPLFASQSTLALADLDRQRRIAMAHDPKQLACAMRTLSLGSMPNYGDELARIERPVDWIVGALDSKFLGLAQDATRRMGLGPRGSARLVSVPGVGHNVVLEAPDQLARMVVERVRSLPATSLTTTERTGGLG